MSISAFNSAAGRQGLAGLVIRPLVDNFGLMAYVAAFAVCGGLAGFYAGHSMDLGMAKVLAFLYTLMLPIFALVLLTAAFLRMAIVERPQRPLARFPAIVAGFVANPSRIGAIVVRSALVVAFVATFGYLKTLIPALHPFSWDIAFRDMDTALFLGTAPWKISFALFGTPFLTTVINAFYHLWLFVVFGFLLSVIFGIMPRQVEKRFLYAFIFTWSIGGNLLATLLSSAGPVFFSRLGLGADYDPQMLTLAQFNQASPVWALDVQDMLWSSYAGSSSGIAGISAMPSMHVASSLVCALAAWRVSRVLGYALFAFTGVIFIGSVHLGWHYAVDGLLAVAIALIAWKAAGSVAAADDRLSKRILGQTLPESA